MFSDFVFYLNITWCIYILCMHINLAESLWDLTNLFAASESWLFVFCWRDWCYGCLDVCHTFVVVSSTIPLWSSSSTILTWPSLEARCSPFSPFWVREQSRHRHFLKSQKSQHVLQVVHKHTSVHRPCQIKLLMLLQWLRQIQTIAGRYLLDTTHAESKRSLVRTMCERILLINDGGMSSKKEGRGMASRWSRGWEEYKPCGIGLTSHSLPLAHRTCEVGPFPHHWYYSSE